jgi:hypothetical protein|tara:strand:- start:16556 stop:16939 length:384 start_codon:yes stop_codon:yes gene_type:complete
MPKFPKSNNYTMKIGNRELHSDHAFRMDSYATQYAMQTNGGKDSKSGETLKIDYFYIPKNKNLSNLLKDLSKNRSTASRDVIQGHIDNLPDSAQNRANAIFKTMSPSYTEVYKPNKDGGRDKEVIRY